MRRFLSATLLTIGTFVVANAAAAQGITLPSPRTVGPSPAVRQLVKLIADAERWVPDSQPARREVLNLIRYRLLLAPFRKKDLDSILAKPTDDAIWARLYEDVLEDGNRSIALAIRRRLNKADDATVRSRAVLIAFALTGVDPDALSRNERATFVKQVQAITEDTVTPDNNTELQQGVQSLVKVSTRKGKGEGRPVEVDDEEALFLPSMLADSADALLKAHLDSLGRLAELVVNERKTHRFWRPARTTAESRVFWKQQGFAPLNLGALTGNKSSGAAYTELTSPLLHSFRLSLNTVVATNAEEAAEGEVPEAPATAEGNETELTRFLNGGGQLNVGGAMPVIYTGRRSGSASLLMLFAPRVGVTLGALGAVQTDESAFLDPAFELHFTSAEVSEGVGFFAQTRSGWAFGGDSFASNLGLPSDDKNFRYTNVAAGLMFGGRYLLSGGRTIDGPKALRGLGWQVGVTLMRSAQ